ncbi:hypothetical protein FMUND_13275 [Fusarium mundagurra]|uniref:FAS1 domain-containing protein n=1 Tax=Fusarium mundagurra TaxID=1567541 RepID=A0A8H5XZI1_9HYPO|nr:hypothetical protein FMUND_13275 [Fusarium mundagurra]
MESNAHLPHSSLGPRALGIVTPFLIIGILVFTVRIYTWVTPVYKLDASDYTISVAVIIEVIVYSLFIASVTSRLGRYNYDVPPEQGVKTLRYVYVVILLPTFVLALVRISVGFLLLEFVLSKAWRAIIWCTIGFQAACVISTEIFQLIQCRPINAHREQVPDARCLSARQIWICGYTTIVIMRLVEMETTLLDFIKSRDDLSELSKLVEQTPGFAQAFGTSADWQYTFIAPSNEAFNNTGEYCKTFASTPKGRWWSGQMLQYHYIPNSRLYTSNFTTEKTRFQMGSYLYASAQIKGGDLVLNNVATIVEADIPVTNLSARRDKTRLSIIGD